MLAIRLSQQSVSSSSGFRRADDGKMCVGGVPVAAVISRILSRISECNHNRVKVHSQSKHSPARWVALAFSVPLSMHFSRCVIPACSAACMCMGILNPFTRVLFNKSDTWWYDRRAENWVCRQLMISDYVATSPASAHSNMRQHRPRQW